MCFLCLFVAIFDFYSGLDRTTLNLYYDATLS